MNNKQLLHLHKKYKIMGCSNSKDKIVRMARTHSKSLGQHKLTMDFLRNELHLSIDLLTDMMKLFSKHETLDYLFDVEEFLLSTKIHDTTPCHLRLIANVQYENKLFLSYLEFVVGLWNFLTLKDDDLKHLILFVFNFSPLDHYPDIDTLKLVIETIHFNDDDCLSRFEIINNFHANCRSSLSHGLVKTVEISDQYKKRRNTIRMSSSIEADHLTGMLVSPALNLQLQLRRLLYGQSYWDDLARERYELPNYNDITSYIALKEKIHSLQVAHIPSESHILKQTGSLGSLADNTNFPNVASPRYVCNSHKIASTRNLDIIPVK